MSTAAPRLLTRAEVAAELRVTTQTVINLVAARKLQETRVPSARGSRSIPRYTRAAIDAYLASGYTR